MRIIRLLLCCLYMCLCLPAAAAERPVLLLDLVGPLESASSDYVVRGLAQAAVRGARLVVLRLDTPGGLDSAMRDVVRAVLASPVPVAGFVAPGGARAAGVSTYILAACPIAAMAPATYLGAVTPVSVDALPDPRVDEPETGDDAATADTPAAHQPINDTRAYLRALAQLHGRNADWAEQAVLASASLSADEALELDVINVIAADVPDLLNQIHGRVVTVLGSEQVLNTADAPIDVLAPDWRNRLLAAMTHPQIAYILLLLVVGFVLVSVVVFIGLGLYALHQRRQPIVSGREALLGSCGVALEDFTAQQGWVRICGETWRAQSRQPVTKGMTVWVIARNGLILDVQPQEKPL